MPEWIIADDGAVASDASGGGEAAIGDSDPLTDPGSVVADSHAGDTSSDPGDVPIDAPAPGDATIDAIPDSDVPADAVAPPDAATDAPGPADVGAGPARARGARLSDARLLDGVGMTRQV
jgi:hypothetical protein